MSVIDSLLAPCSHFLRAIFRRDEVERELREELDGYFGMLVEQNLAKGYVAARGAAGRLRPRSAWCRWSPRAADTAPGRTLRAGSPIAS